MLILKQDLIKMHRREQGFGVVEMLVVVVVVGILAAAGWMVLRNKPSDSKANQTNNSEATSPQSSSTAEASSEVTWMQTSDGYQPSGPAPTCPDQLVEQLPADINQVTSVLYPGQYRTGNYKPHGGFRFDDAASNSITVKAPFDGTIIDGAAYLAEGVANDVQYTFDVMNDCGYMFRVGHLLTLSPELAAIVKAFPAPVKGDSRTTNVNPGVKIKAGTVMATAVGTSSDKNVFFDWGVYDWRKPNAVSADATWLAGSQHDNNLAKHAVCWFDLLESKDEAKIRSLPSADSGSGKTSDYCK